MVYKLHLNIVASIVVFLFIAAPSYADRICDEQNTLEVKDYGGALYLMEGWNSARNADDGGHGTIIPDIIGAMGVPGSPELQKKVDKWLTSPDVCIQIIEEDLLIRLGGGS